MFWFCKYMWYMQNLYTTETHCTVLKYVATKSTDGATSIVRLILENDKQGGMMLDDAWQWTPPSSMHSSTAVTCDFVAHQFTRLNFSDTSKQALELLLSHVLRQIVHYQVSFTIFYASRLHRRGAVV